MWKIFYSPETIQWKSFQALEAWKEELFNTLESHIKDYFAKKVVVYFDNMMIFHQKRGLHHNLMESLSLAEKEMQEVGSLFPSVYIYVLKEDNGCALITSGLEDKYIDTLSPYGFELVENNAHPGTDKEEKMKFLSWSTLVFDIELVNFAKGWINHTPSLDERSILQAEYILMNMHFRKNESTLLEKIEFKKNIKNHPQYEELYQKVLRVMPKIESSLEQEWRTAIIQTKIQQNIGQIKKTKTSI
jgi:hypothetical protein